MVSAFNINNDKEIKYYIQHNLTDSKKDFIVITPFSPVGKNLMGKKVGDEVEIEIPHGNLKLKIIGIEKKL